MNDKKLDAESYLKSGSNELRILEYRVAGTSFGINILKVSKIVNELTDFTKVPESHPTITGIFKDMDHLIPIVDLAKLLNINNENSNREKVIVTEFFGIRTGFQVDQIDWIHHFKWEDIIDAKQVFSKIEQPYVLGIVKATEKRMIQLLDYESILLNLNPELASQNKSEYKIQDSLQNKKILIAEDSPAVRAMLVNELTENGFEVKAASDGKEGWNLYQKEDFDLVICDVEMPRMDGLALTLRIRQSQKSDTPVIVYSSIGDIGMKARAKFLKADAHITKLNLDKLLQTVEKLLEGEQLNFEVEDEQQENNTEKNLIPS
ncbi:MAG: chemotaxis protein CheV [Promethearchaeota archaeon]